MRIYLRVALLASLSICGKQTNGLPSSLDEVSLYGNGRTIEQDDRQYGNGRTIDKGDTLNESPRPHSFLDSLFDMQRSSPLFQMIADAVSKRMMEGSTNNSSVKLNSEEFEKGAGNTTMMSALHSLNMTQVEEYIIPMLNRTNPHYLHATLNQIGGELGEGSKFIEGMPSLANYRIDPTTLGTMASAGAVALMAIGAMFAVPAAPGLLRRTGAGNNGGGGWGGLPSFSNLFSWFRSDDEPPNPNYIDYANNPYYQSHYDGPQEFVYTNDDEYANYEHSEDNSNYYQERQQYEEPSQDEYGTWYQSQQQNSFHVNPHQQESHTRQKQYQQKEGQTQQYYQAQPQQNHRRRFTRPKKAPGNKFTRRPTTQVPDQGGEHSYQVYDSYSINEDQQRQHQQKQQQQYYNQQQKQARERKAQRRFTKDGYTYVSLNQVNRIADESLNSLVEHYEKMQNRRYSDYFPESEEEQTHSMSQQHEVISSPTHIQYQPEEEEEIYQPNFFTIDDAVQGSTLSPLQRDQQRYKIAYETRYANFRKTNAAAVSLTDEPGTQSSASSDRSSTATAADHMTSTKEFPYEYQES